MSQWKKVKLKDICLSISDGDHLPPPKTDHGIPFITISNIDSTNHLDFSNTLFVPQEYYDNVDEKRKAKAGDILYSVVGSFGKPVLIMENKPFAFQRHIAILRPDNDIVDSAFMYYAMMTCNFYMQADSVALGAAQRTISLGSLRDMTIEMPTKDVQQRIANILSKYDSLIENYQQQIKLLEETAQRLYKEWFVDLHFPGYENTKIVDGVPEGWEFLQLIDCYIFQYGKILATKNLIKDGKYPVYGASKVIGYYNKANCFNPVVLIGSRGNAGYVHRTIEQYSYVTNNSFIVKPKRNHEFMGLPFIYESFLCMDFKSICTGAAQPQLTLSSLASMKYLLPDLSLIKNYCLKAQPSFDRISNIFMQLRLLTEARDRLLPKLMSGEIEV